MKLSIGATSKLLGISVRTLHYYNEIGLVMPSEISEAGYRFYDDAAISKLQQIMFYRELEFSLKDISKIFSNPSYDKTMALISQKELLILKKKHLDNLINLIDNTIKGDDTMNNEINQTAKDLANAKKKYAAEVKQRWGNTSEYAQSIEKHKNLTEEDEKKILEDAEEIFKAFAQNVGKDATNSSVQKLVSKWQSHISKYYYDCSNEVLSCLGEMYLLDERFKSNLDKYKEGTAQLMSDAIKIYCSK